MTKPNVALRRWRMRSGLSQSAAGKRLDPSVSQGTWAAWENGRKPPSLGNALGIERLTEGLIRAADWVTKQRRPKRRAPESGTNVAALAAKAS